MRRPNISGKRPWEPDAVVEFEDQEDVDSPLDCKANTKYIVVIHEVKHGFILLLAFRRASTH